MISEAELRRHAVAAGVDVMVQDLDYGLGWFLAGLFTQTSAAQHLVFKGGTCLRKCYFANYRFSEDLDFTLRQAWPIASVGRSAGAGAGLESGCRWAGLRGGLGAPGGGQRRLRAGIVPGPGVLPWPVAVGWPAARNPTRCEPRRATAVPRYSAVRCSIPILTRANCRPLPSRATTLPRCSRRNCALFRASDGLPSRATSTIFISSLDRRFPWQLSGRRCRPSWPPRACHPTASQRQT